MIKVIAEQTAEELVSLAPANATHYRFTADGEETAIVKSIKKLSDIEGVVGSLEWGNGAGAKFTAIVEVADEAAPKTKAPKEKKDKELTPEQLAAKAAKEERIQAQRAKMELIDSMIAPVGFDTPPTKEEYREAKGEGADINLADYKHTTEEIVTAVLESQLEQQKEGEDVSELRFRVMKNIQARKFNMVRADKVAGYKPAVKEGTVKGMSPERLTNFFKDDLLIEKLTDEQIAYIVKRISR